MDEEVASIHSENQALHKQQATLGNEVRTLKQQAAQLTDDIAAEKCKLGNVAADCDRLRGQIVQVGTLQDKHYIHTGNVVSSRLPVKRSSTYSFSTT